MIYLKEFNEWKLYGRVVIKLSLGEDKDHKQNSIITLMRLNERTWNQTLKNWGRIVWKKLDKTE